MPRKKSTKSDLTPDEKKCSEDIMKELDLYGSTVKVIEAVPKMDGFPVELEEDFIKQKKDFAWSRTEVKILQHLEDYLQVKIPEGDQKA